jgi:hypothetical protein
MLGKKFKWQLIPIRLDLETFEALKRMAPNGDVKRLIRETIEKLKKPSFICEGSHRVRLTFLWRFQNL